MLEAVLFDLDGTITRPNLDFDAMRAELGVRDRTPLLEWMASQPEALRRRAWEVIDAHELRAAQAAELSSGARELLGAVMELGLRTGLVTRNSARSVDIVLDRLGLHFDAVVTREDCAPKPSPDPVLECARRLGARPECTLMVGDYPFDVHSGHAAGAVTALVGTRPKPLPPGYDPGPQAHYQVAALHELIPIVRRLAAEG